jgi:hypothetical protein
MIERKVPERNSLVWHRNGNRPLGRGALHNNVAAALTNATELVSFQNRTHLLARQDTEFTHKPPQTA